MKAWRVEVLRSDEFVVPREEAESGATPAIAVGVDNTVDALAAVGADAAAVAVGGPRALASGRGVRWAGDSACGW